MSAILELGYKSSSLFLYLRNEVRESRLDEVVMALTAEMVFLSGMASSREDAHSKCENAVTSGRAAEKFARMVTAMGGPSDLMENYDSHLATAAVAAPACEHHSRRPAR